jgi:hypothetical protein
VPPESGVEAENENVKTIQEHVKTRTFSAKGAEKIRHPRGFQSCKGSLRCRAEGSATRPSARTKLVITAVIPETAPPVFARGHDASGQNQDHDYFEPALTAWRNVCSLERGSSI